MKSVYVLIIIVLLTIFSNAQTPQDIIKQRKEKYDLERKEYNEGLVDTSRRYFYKSYEDYVNNKPVEGVKYTGKRKILLDNESVLVLENDEFDYKKIKELAYWGFIDEYGQLERIFKNHCYYVLDSGKISHYLKATDVEMSTDKNGNIKLNWLSANPDGFKDYISEGLSGPITEFNEKKFENLTLTHPEIYQQYVQQPIDHKAKDKRSQKSMLIRKYVNEFNKLN
jgi:hypothetical protein